MHLVILNWFTAIKWAIGVAHSLSFNLFSFVINLLYLSLTYQIFNDPSIFLSKCDKWIKAYHLSDNDGESDSNQSISKDSWFWPDLIQKLDYYCLEIYDVSLSCLGTQINLTRSKLKL